MNKYLTLSRTLTLGVARSFWIGDPQVYAGSAEWSEDAPYGWWLAAENWTPNTVPNGSADIATFDVSNVTNILAPGSAHIEVDSIVFNADETEN